MSDDVWQVGDPAPGTKHSTLGALDPLIGTPRRGPSDLPGFLLARIAEDEEFALRYPPTAAARPRALAECEAKRRIVEVELWREVGPASHYVSKKVHAQITARTATSVMRLLALPYADHPDFREEWKA